LFVDQIKDAELLRIIMKYATVSAITLLLIAVVVSVHAYSDGAVNAKTHSQSALISAPKPSSNKCNGKLYHCADNEIQSCNQKQEWTRQYTFTTGIKCAINGIFTDCQPN
jgi:hypothetical protein